jgi:hypothetical protein
MSISSMDPADVARYGPRVGPVVASEAGRWHPHVVWVALYMTAIPHFFVGDQAAVEAMAGIIHHAISQVAVGCLSHPNPVNRTKAKILIAGAMGLEAGPILSDPTFSWERLHGRGARRRSSPSRLPPSPRHARPILLIPPPTLYHCAAVPVPAVTTRRRFGRWGLPPRCDGRLHLRRPPPGDSIL